MRLITIALLLCLFVVACNSKQESNVTNSIGIDSVRAIKTDEVQTVLPQSGNVVLIEANCVPCHSLRYIEMQPNLSYKAWEKTVDKMITAFGAPVRDSATRKDIIEYLYAIKGKK